MRVKNNKILFNLRDWNFSLSIAPLISNSVQTSIDDKFDITQVLYVELMYIYS